MYIHTDWPGPDRRVVQGRCPNAGNACNCIGRCQPIVVDKDDPRSDEEIRESRNVSMHAWEQIQRMARGEVPRLFGHRTRDLARDAGEVDD